MVITYATRIQETLSTLKAFIAAGAKVILCSHHGRPKGQRDPKESLAPVAPALSELLGVPVEFSEETIGPVALAKAMALPAGGVLLLENTRYHAGEEKNDPELAKGLAELAEVFVNDAFGSAHRAHSYTAGVADYLPAVSGLLMEKELTYLHDELENPERPFVVILGGAKVNDKIEVINRLLEKADTIIIGGGMAYTFRKIVQGISIGKSAPKSARRDQLVGRRHRLQLVNHARLNEDASLLFIDRHVEHLSEHWAGGVRNQSRMAMTRYEAWGMAREPDGGTPGRSFVAKFL